jgi:Ser/Thr protein kinase RdoA (MazF antagonist)
VSVSLEEPDAEILARAFQWWGVEAGSHELLGGSRCRVYAFRRENADLVLRLMSPDPGRGLQMSNAMEWVDYLARHEASICAPVLSLRGRSLEVVRNGFGRGYVAAVFQRVGGTPVTSLQSDRWTPALFELCGRTLGEIHALSKRFKPPRFGLGRYRWTGSGVVRLARRVLPAAEHRVLDRIERYCREFSRLPRERDDFGLIHGDFHQGNYHLDGDRLRVFDFGGCTYGWYACDIAVSVYASLLDRVQRGEENLERHARAYFVPFLRGYGKATRLAPMWLDRISDFLQLFNLSIFVALSESKQASGPLFEFVAECARSGRPCLDVDFAQLCREAETS